jgi:type I restriction enzyme S subunit
MAGEPHALHTPAAITRLAEGWTWSRLDVVCDGVFDCPHSTPVLTEAGPYVVRSQDIRTGVFRGDEAAHVSEETYRERIARAEPRHGDLLYSREGTYFGIAAEVPRGVRLCLGQRMVLLRPTPWTADSRFLMYWLNSSLMASHIHGFRDGSVAERLNMPTIRALPVAIPPLAEQRAIAHILGVLDDKIDLNRRMSETLEAMARALFQSWFVDFEPVRAKMEGRDAGLPKSLADLFPARLVDSELGEIPEGWEVVALTDLVDVNPPRHLRKGDVAPYLDMANMPTRGHSPDEVIPREFGSGMRFMNGDTLVARITPCLENGKTAFVDFLAPGETGWGSTEYIVFRSRPPLANEFGYCLARSERFREFAIQSMTGSSGRQRVSPGSLGYFRVAAPTSEASARIAAAFGHSVQPLFARAARATRESRTLAALRGALLPKLTSGQLRVHNTQPVERTVAT